MLVQEEKEEVGDVEEVGEEERMENLEEGQLKIGEQVEKYDLRYDSETDTASSSFGDGDEERSVECGEENTTMLEMEVQGEEEILHWHKVRQLCGPLDQCDGEHTSDHSLYGANRAPQRSQREGERVLFFS